MSMVSIRDLSFAYAGKQPIFDNFSLDIHQGENWIFIGPSGCGKSTLLALIAGLARPKKGEIQVAGETLRRPRPETGLVFQDHGLLPWATAENNAALGLRIRDYYGSDGKHTPAEWGQKDPENPRKVRQWLKRLGLEGKEDLYPAQLSRGQRQRAATARTLVMQPDLLLMDEPFSALDPPVREELRRLIIKLGKRTGITRIFVTHDIPEAAILGEKILLVSSGINRKARILQNNLAFEKEPEKHPAFEKICKKIRQSMGDI